MSRVELITNSDAETRAVGRRLAVGLRGGERIGLAGDLGAGKTTLVRGIAEGLGIRPGLVRSPSFPILLPYEDGRLPLFHIDLFRLPASDIDSLALREYIYGFGVSAIEWYERLDEPLQDYLELSLAFGGGDRRSVSAVAHGSGCEALVEILEEIARKPR